MKFLFIHFVLSIERLNYKITSYYPRSSTETREGYNLTLPFVVFRGTYIYSSYYWRFLTKMQGGYHNTLYLIVQQLLQQKIFLTINPCQFLSRPVGTQCFWSSLSCHIRWLCSCFPHILIGPHTVGHGRTSQSLAVQSLKL